MTPFIFQEEIFDVEIHLLVPCPPDELKAYLHNSVGEDYNPGGYRGFCYHSDDKTFIALEDPWTGSIKNISALSHECFHAACQILFVRDVKYTSDTEEVYAYLHESIFRRCLLALEGPDDPRH